MTEEEFKKITGNEAFVGLIHQCLHDRELCRKVMYALRSDDLTRVDIIRDWVTSSKKKKAPDNFVQALLYLEHKEIAHDALRQLIH